MHISVVTPAYKCARSIDELYNRLILTFEKMNISDFEIIFINDASPEKDWAIISTICERDKRVKGINLSRNFGQHAAITAGLDHATGDRIVVLDCDLQDQPEEIQKLYNKFNEGYDVVFGRRYLRKDSFIRKASSNIFNIIFSFLLGRKIDNSISNLSMISRQVANAFAKMREHDRDYVLFILWLGFKTAFIDVEHARRPHGKSSYNWGRLIEHAINISVSHSNKPIKIFLFIGFGVSILSFILGTLLILRKLIFDISVEGWTSVIVSLYFIGGIIISIIGIIGIYLGKVYDEAKNRPIYVVKELI